MTTQGKNKQPAMHALNDFQVFLMAFFLVWLLLLVTPKSISQFWYLHLDFPHEFVDLFLLIFFLKIDIGLSRVM